MSNRENLKRFAVAEVAVADQIIAGLSSHDPWLQHKAIDDAKKFLGTYAACDHPWVLRDLVKYVSKNVAKAIPGKYLP
jgi:hypothetical protein